MRHFGRTHHAAYGIFMAALLPLLGCQPAETPKAPAGEAATEHDDHAHAHAEEHGPHDGEIVELGGGKYHAELLHDHAAHKVTVHVLGEDAKTPAKIDADELALNVVADGQTSQYKLPKVDAAGAKFELVDEALCDAIDAAGAKARLTIAIGEQSFTGDVPSHDDHDHEGHDHEGHQHE